MDTINEQDGIAEMRHLINDFLSSKQGSSKVREYISSVAQDDSRLRIYLKERKYRATYAWETLKCYAEVRFDKYPELFPDESHDMESQIRKCGVLTMLKSRDNLGRRLVCLNAEKWNPDEVSIDLMTTFGVCFSEREILDEDIMKNGLILIKNFSGMGFKHARMGTLHNMLRLLNVFWYAYPVKVGAVYVVNLPSYLIYLYKLIKPFFSKELKEIFILSTANKKFEVLHENISPELLPKCLGGIQEDEDVFDWEFLQPKTTEVVAL